MTPCVLWDKGRSMGYGIAYRDGRVLRAHQAAWLDAALELPSDRQLHHVCRNKLCVNVDHLVLVTPAEHTRLHSRDPRNTRNGNVGKTHCVHGHEFTAENTDVRPNGHRRCRTCHREMAARTRRENPERVREINRRASRRYYAKHRKGVKP